MLDQYPFLIRSTPSARTATLMGIRNFGVTDMSLDRLYR